jgi:preprotein translocase subunit Sec61beta
MHAHEINDIKIDPKATISSAHTISSLLKNNKIKLPGQLSI